MQLLLIKISATHANPEYALLGNKQAEDRFTPSTWDKIGSLTKGRKVVLLLPNSEVVLTTANVPSKNKKQLHQAIPYALEDTLAEDIEKLHFVIQQPTALAESHVAIINRDRLDVFIDLLRKNGVTLHYVLPQLLAQPFQEKGWSIFQQSYLHEQQQAADINVNQLVTVRLGKYEGFTCDRNLLPIFLTEQLEKSSPESISSNIDASDLPEGLQALSIVKADPAIVQYDSVEKSLPLNLLTGFISHKKESNINWKVWRAPMVLASLVTATVLGILGWQNSQLQQEQKQLKQSIEKVFTTTFPKSRIVDAPQQMSSELTQLKKTSIEIVDSPLPLISNIAPLLKRYKDLKLKEIRYQENELQMVMQSPNLTRIEAFKKEAATKSKLKVSVKSSTTTANKVEAVLTIAPLDAASIKESSSEAQS